MKKNKYFKKISDSTLKKAWRSAVINQQKHCFFCKNSDTSTLEVHHIQGRRHKVLRAHIKNLVLVCGIPGAFYGKSCHVYASQPEGQKKLFESENFNEKWLTEFGLKTIKDLLTELRQVCYDLTEDEFIYLQYLALLKLGNDRRWWL